MLSDVLQVRGPAFNGIMSFPAAVLSAAGEAEKIGFIEEIVFGGPMAIARAVFLVVCVLVLLLWIGLVLIRRRLYLGLLATGLLSGLVVGWLSHRIDIGKAYNLRSIRLLSGYTLSHGPGIDSYGGWISRTDGFRIHIDIGEMGGLFIDPEKPEELVWLIEQAVNGHKVLVGLRHQEHDGKTTLGVTFPGSEANFWAEVHSERDIAEMLAMLFTYEPVPREL